MSKEVKEEVRSKSSDAPTMSKAERRAAGKVAAKKRLAAKRRRKALQNSAVALAGIAVVVVLVVVFGGFGGGSDPTVAGSASTAPSASAGAAPATAVPADLDPALKTAPVVKAGTGDVTELKVTTLVEGTGPAVRPKQTISVNYVGVTYTTGEKFDSSWDSGRPFQTIIGDGKVIPGWDQGLIGIKVGSRVQLDIPAELAYGETPQQAGAPSGDLRFVVDILSVS